MKLKAYVKRVTGKTIHSIGSIVEGAPVKKAKMPDVAWVVIEETDGSYSLIRYSSTGKSAGDTWHESLQDAKQQAQFEYEIRDSDWSEEE